MLQAGDYPRICRFIPIIMPPITKMAYRTMISSPLATRPIPDVYILLLERNDGPIPHFVLLQILEDLGDRLGPL